MFSQKELSGAVTSGKAKVRKEGDQYVISFDYDGEIKSGYYIIKITNSNGKTQAITACRVES